MDLPPGVKLWLQVAGKPSTRHQQCAQTWRRRTRQSPRAARVLQRCRRGLAPPMCRTCALATRSLLLWSCASLTAPPHSHRRLPSAVKPKASSSRTLQMTALRGMASVPQVDVRGGSQQQERRHGGRRARRGGRWQRRGSAASRRSPPSRLSSGALRSAPPRTGVQTLLAYRPRWVQLTR